MPKAVLIPCSPLQSCQLIDLPDEPNHLGRLTELIGEEPEDRCYDPDTVVYTSADAQSLNRARNERASRYAFAQSGAAKERGMDPGTPMNALPALLYGDAVLVGQAADGALADVPGRFLDPGHLGWSFEPTPFDFPMPPLISSPIPAAARTGRTAPLPRVRADRRRGSR